MTWIALILSVNFLHSNPAPVPPVQRDGWIVPADADDALPIWGHPDGIRVGLWPTNGPRGLIRIYAPYVENPPDQVINFIAIEPLVRGRRGYSELEKSALDGVPGKRMWTVDELTPDGAAPQSDSAPATQPTRPDRGKVINIDGSPALSFWVTIEPFDSGARPVVQVILRKDRPREVAFRIFAAPGSAKMDACILSATMGNYARLRRLHLKDRIVTPSQLWPNFTSTEPWGKGFTPHSQWGIKEMSIRNSMAQVQATGDETDPSKARYAEGTASWWRYQGKRSVQHWRSAARDDLLVRVNGRKTYWGSHHEIPGGTAFENFEMQAPFEAGQEFIFGVEVAADK